MRIRAAWLRKVFSNASSEKTIEGIVTLSVAYLCTPLLFFLFCFPKFYIAWPLGLLALALLGSVFKKTRPMVGVFRYEPLVMALVWVAFTGLLATYFSGKPHIFPTDWPKHFTVFNTLRDCQWMPRVEYAQQQFYLRYYIGWLITPAVLASYLPVYWGQLIIYSWTVLGIYLAFSLFLEIAPKRPFIVLSSFILFGGFDVLGLILLPNAGSHNHEGYEWWSAAVHSLYLAPGNLMIWVPQHAVVGWILAGLLLDRKIASQILPHVGIVLAASALWSPFAAAGSLPLVAMHGKVKELITKFNLAAVPVGLAICGYLLQGTSDLPSALRRIRSLEDAKGLFIFYIVEFGLWALALRFFGRSVDKRALMFVTIALVLYPFWQFGLAGDWVMRASIPCLGALAVMAAREISDLRLRVLSWYIFLFFLVLGSISPGTELWKSYTGYFHGGTEIKNPMDESLRNVFGWHAQAQLLSKKMVGANSAPVCKMN